MVGCLLANGVYVFLEDIYIESGADETEQSLSSCVDQFQRVTNHF